MVIPSPLQLAQLAQYKTTCQSFHLNFTITTPSRRCSQHAVLTQTERHIPAEPVVVARLAPFHLRQSPTHQNKFIVKRPSILAASHPGVHAASPGHLSLRHSDVSLRRSPLYTRILQNIHNPTCRDNNRYDHAMIPMAT